jgi:SAM-dependent methyltransferase
MRASYLVKRIKPYSMSAQTAVKQFIRNSSHKIFGDGSDKIKKLHDAEEVFTENLAFRISLETMLNMNNVGKSPFEIFFGITDQFWFWLNTEGIRKNATLRNLLPGIADEETQKMFTGKTGDRTLWEGFYYYRLFKEHFEKYKGNISSAKILDFGCGWGRIIRYFIKDIPASNLWGCDPTSEMITLCNEQNKWANFETINPDPPTPFEENSFDMIYSFSVFSHLSEDFHYKVLQEIKRILKPGGIYMTTTRNRDFILDGNSGFTDIPNSLSLYDKGSYVHLSHNSDKWRYWGESAISKQYVQDCWTNEFTFLDYIEDNFQNLIIIQKPL